MNFLISEKNITMPVGQKEDSEENAESDASAGVKKAPKAYATNKGVSVALPATVSAVPLATIPQVKKLIAGKAENKLCGIVHQAQYNAFIDSAADAYPLLPVVPAGTGDNQRIGNRITPKGLRVSVSVYFNSKGAQPVGTVLFPRILALSDRKFSNITQATSQTDFTHLLDEGLGEHNFQGTLASYRCPINSEAYRVHKDIRTQLSLNDVESTGMICKTFTFWIKCPKTLMYNDQQAYPNNFAPFICMGYATGDGTVPTEQYTGLTLDITSTLYYEDS